MAKSIIAVTLILIIIISGSVAGLIYISNTTEQFSAMLGDVIDEPTYAEIDEIYSQWEDKKTGIMMIINHRDVEEVSVALLRAREEAAAGREDKAALEIELAIFLMNELVEREKLSLPNIL